jgi:hypothetical protein
MLPALSLGAIHIAPPQTSFVSFTGCSSKIASNLNLQPSPTIHSLPTIHHNYPLLFIHMSPAKILPYAPPANIFSPFPDAELNFANALSVTVLQGSGATSVSKFDQPLHAVAIFKRHLKTNFLAQPPAVIPHLPPSYTAGPMPAYSDSWSHPLCIT